MNATSMVAESDIAPYKPKTDIIVQATALAPGGKPAVSWEVEVAVCSATATPRFPPRPQPLNPMMEVDPEAIRRWEGEVRLLQLQAEYQRGESIVRKRLRIIGQRYWKRLWWPRRLVNAVLAVGTLGMLRLSSWRLTFPKPLVELPIRYEYAWGGCARLALEDGTELFLAAPQNTVGLGYFPTPAEIRREYGVGRFTANRWWKRLFRQIGKKVPAPMIECPRHSVSRFGESRAAEGFGIVTKAWEPRSNLAGTFDEQWQQEKAPMLPDDFDSAYWNGAHAELQAPHLKGDEHIHLTNMKLEGPLSGMSATEFKVYLPKRTLRIRVSDSEERCFVGLLALDTVIVNMHEGKATLIWRTTVGANIAVAHGIIEEVNEE